LYRTLEELKFVILAFSIAESVPFVPYLGGIEIVLTITMKI